MAVMKAARSGRGPESATPTVRPLFRGDEGGFAQLFDETGVLLLKLLIFLLQRVAFGFRATLLRREGLAHPGLRLPPPGRQ